MPESPEWRSFTIPGNGSEDWDPERHGHELQEDDDRLGTEEFATVEWRPGQYEFNYGSSGSSFVLQVPEPHTQLNPNQKILQGFHEFLKVAHDEFL